MQRNSVLKLIAAGFIAGVLGIAELNAQPPGGGGPTDEPPCWPPPCIPIDGGVSFLIAAGVAFGAKKVYDLRGKG